MGRQPSRSSSTSFEARCSSASPTAANGASRWRLALWPISTAGFWPGGGGVEEAGFYSYAYPAPAGFADAVVLPGPARFDAALGEFLLPYEAVRTASDPEAALMEFLQTTYEAAADLGGWDRS